MGVGDCGLKLLGFSGSPIVFGLTIFQMGRLINCVVTVMSSVQGLLLHECDDQYAVQW